MGTLTSAFASDYAFQKQLSQVSKGHVELKDMSRSMVSWPVYGAEFLTIFFALALLSGRVYAESYWNVFGLSPELVGSTFINYAIVSPNTAVASVLMAAGTVGLIRVFTRRPPPDFIGDLHPKAAIITGALVFGVGVLAISIIPRVNLSTWIDGTAGLAFGTGFLCFTWGFIIWMQASMKQETKPQPRWVFAIDQWVRKHVAVKLAVIQVFVVVGLTTTSLWAMLDTADKFGFNEAVTTYDTIPVATLLLDSPIGFEDLVYSSNAIDSALMRVKIITEAGAFLYVSPGVARTPLQLYVRAVPVSRVQAIHYAVDIAPPD